MIESFVKQTLVFAREGKEAYHRLSRHTSKAGVISWGKREKIWRTLRKGKIERDILKMKAEREKWIKDDWRDRAWVISSLIRKGRKKKVLATITRKCKIGVAKIVRRTIKRKRKVASQRSKVKRKNLKIRELLLKSWTDAILKTSEFLKTSRYIW